MRGCWVSKVYGVCKALGYDWLTRCPDGAQGVQAWIMRTELPIADLLDNFVGQLTVEWRAESLEENPRSFPETEGRRRPGAPGDFTNLPCHCPTTHQV